MKRKRSKEVSLDKIPSKKQKTDGIINQPNYNLCIICQKPPPKNQKDALYNVQSVDTLKTAMSYRQDIAAQQLELDINKENWLLEKKPKWHADCRNRYTQKKLYMVAAENKTEVCCKKMRMKLKLKN